MYMCSWAMPQGDLEARLNYDCGNFIGCVTAEADNGCRFGASRLYSLDRRSARDLAPWKMRRDLQSITTCVLLLAASTRRLYTEVDEFEVIEVVTLLTQSYNGERTFTTTLISESRLTMQPDMDLVVNQSTFR